MRKSIFSGLIYCAKCGHALCSEGSVYKGEREKYWYLGCTQKRKGALKPCSGVRIKYVDLLEIIRQDLNTFISMSDEDIKEIVAEIMKIDSSDEAIRIKKRNIEKAKARISIIDKTISKLYLDNASGAISDTRLNIVVEELEKEYGELTKFLQQSEEENETNTIEENMNSFFDIVRKYTNIEEVTRDILLTFIDRIEIGEKVFPEGVVRNTHLNQPFTQEIKIKYKFINDILDVPEKSFPLEFNKETPSREDVNIEQAV